MDAASQQKILGYFIEEAKEHLETLEQGILELSEVINDTERVNELFRAAHSVKGGAAMLGYTSIQKTAHRLEDAFKIFKENKIDVDENLKSLFLSAYDVLHELLEKLQSPFGLQEEEAHKIMAEADPQFVELQSYLDKLVSSDEDHPVSRPSIPTPTIQAPPAIPVVSLGEQLRNLLRQMLALFKQSATPNNRQQLQKICVELAKLDKDTKAWQTIVKAAHKAIGNPGNSFNVLAPVIIKDIKEAGDHLELNEPEKIDLSADLKALAVANFPQILIPIEPQSAAKTLAKAFSKKQISQLVQLLSQQK